MARIDEIMNTLKSPFITMVLFILAGLIMKLNAQDLEVTGKVKVLTTPTNNSADSVAVILDDGTLAKRSVSTLTEYQILSISSDTIYLTNGGYVKLPADKVDDADPDPTNEIQNLSITGDTIYLSESDSIVLPLDMNAGWTMNGDTTLTIKHVGIGVSNPTERLEVFGRIKSIVPNYGFIHLNDGTVMGTYVSSIGGEIGTQSNHSLHFFTNNQASQVTLTPAGDFGIGTDTPGAKLEVDGKVKIRMIAEDATLDSILVVDGEGEIHYRNVSTLSNGMTYAIGDLAHGGIVFFVNATGTHGLVAANVDQNFNNWYRSHDELSNPSRHDGEGAKYFDWRLPSRWELNEMWKNLHRNGCPLDSTPCPTSLGRFSSDDYWSSTEDIEYLGDPSNQAWFQNFLDGSQDHTNKGAANEVRSVRAF